MVLAPLRLNPFGSSDPGASIEGKTNIPARKCVFLRTRGAPELTAIPSNILVPGVGLEPTLSLRKKDFKSFASADFATRAR